MIIQMFVMFVKELWGYAEKMLTLESIGGKV
jgi:hypothetical protein